HRVRGMSAHSPAQLCRYGPALLVLALVAFLIVLAGAPASATTHATATAEHATGATPSSSLSTARQGAANESGQTRPVVFIGVDGLAWADITEDTPALSSLTAQAVGSLVVRSVNTSTCPADGWLALNTGARAADTASPCRTLKSPTSGEVPAWDAYSQAVASQDYGAKLGRLQGALKAGDLSSTAIGPGAAIALATPSGTVKGYEPLRNADALSAQVREAVTSTDLTVVDAGTITDPEVITDRAEEAAEEAGKDFDEDAVEPPTRQEQVQ